MCVDEKGMSKRDRNERIQGSIHNRWPQMKAPLLRSPSSATADEVAVTTRRSIQSERSSSPPNSSLALCPFSSFQRFRLMKRRSSTCHVYLQNGIRHSWKRKRPEFFTWWALWLPILFLAHQYPAAGDEAITPMLSNATFALVANFQPSVIRYRDAQPSPAFMFRRKVLQNSSPTKRPSFTTPVSAPTVIKPPTRFPTNKPFLPQTLLPTQTPFLSPSRLPSDSPSSNPSLSPSQFPSFMPTFSENLTTFSLFTQQFVVGETSVFSDEQVTKFEILFESYTYIFGNSEFVANHKINTTCRIIKQILQHPTRRGLRDLKSLANSVGKDRLLLSTTNTSSTAINTVQYSITFNSFVLNVTSYPDLFRNYVTQNILTVVLDLRQLGLNVTSSQPPLEVVVTPSPTFTPTISQRPSPVPSQLPSVSRRPSVSPSSAPTPGPTININPTATPTARTQHPSSSPSMAPSHHPPSSDTATVVGVAVAGGIALILIALFIFWYLRRKRLRESAFQAVPINGSGRKRTPSRLEITRVTSWRPSSHARTPSTSMTHPIRVSSDSRNAVPYPVNAAGVAGGPGLISPSDSMASHQSMISAGNSVGPDSVEDEPDATQNLADEFDKYKDQNLEKMRADVEGNLSGFDGMMSQALTKALMEDDELNSDPKELLWGGHGKQTGIEIEASALCEVNDWLKRTENATLDES